MAYFQAKPLDCWYRGATWGTKALEGTVESVHGNPDIRYQVIGLTPWQCERYNPLTDTPHAYLEFARLGESKRKRNIAKYQIDNILSFCHEYGPPWEPWGKIYNASEEVPDFAYLLPVPLTVARILDEAIRMSSLIRTYNLLTRLNNYEITPPVLKEHMIQIQNKGWGYLTHRHLYTSEEGLRLAMMKMEPNIYGINENSLPPLRTDDDVIKAAIAYLIAGVHQAITFHIIYPSLANVEDNRQQEPQENKSIIGAWVPAFSYSSLLAVLWWQFYNDILNKTPLRECANENCRNTFIPNRSDHVFCKPSCRVAKTEREQYKANKSRRQS